MADLSKFLFADLRSVFASEAMTAQRYSYFAQVAEIEGHPEIAQLFSELSESTACIAHGHLDILRTVADPGSGQPMGDTQLNVAAAVAGGREESAELYPRLLAAAHDEGLADVAGWLTTLETLKKAHAKKLEDALAAITEEPLATGASAKHADREWHDDE